VRLSDPRDLGLYVRDQRRDRGMTQADLCASAQVSRRWLSDLEAGKPTAEIGLVFKVLHALGLAVDAHQAEPDPGGVDLDAILREHGWRDTGQTGDG
jgi:HTH-type transcriptional regulator/antitoxin HipB